MRHVVVTGAAGFIGGHLTERLAADGHRVVAVDRRPVWSTAAAAVLTADLAEPDVAVADALRTADAVFHLAGCAGVRDRDPDIQLRRHRDNVLAGARVLAITPAEVPVVVTSSSSVYGGAAGAGGTLRPCHEDGRLTPWGGYARSKAALEDLCAVRAARGGHVAVARPFTVAGERQRRDMAIARWLVAARDGDPLRVLGSLDRVRDVTDVRDVVEGLVRMATRGLAATINLGTGRGRRLAELVAAVGAVTGTTPRVTVEPVAVEEPPATLADTTRCAQLLAFVPVTDLAVLVRRQVDAAAQPALVAIR